MKNCTCKGENIWYNKHIESKKKTKEEVTKMLKTVGVVREREREREKES